MGKTDLRLCVLCIQRFAHLRTIESKDTNNAAIAVHAVTIAVLDIKESMI